MLYFKLSTRISDRQDDFLSIYLGTPDDDDDGDDGDDGDVDDDDDDDDDDVYKAFLTYTQIKSPLISFIAFLILTLGLASELPYIG